MEEWAQVRVTRVTVNDCQESPEPAPYGTQLARRPVSLNLPLMLTGSRAPP
jgi:hypothetical protein